MLTFLFTKTPLLFFVQSFWRDEAFTYLLAKQNIVTILVNTAKDFNPPLYYLLIHSWIKLFGASEVSLRTVSLIFFWLTIYAFYLILQDVLHIPLKRIVYYLFLAVINPLLLYFAFEARMYAMLAFFATLSSYAFLTKRKRLFLVISILGLYTHYFMLFVSLTQILFYFIVHRRRSRKELNQYLAPMVLFIPWLIFVIVKKGIGVESFWIEKSTLETFVKLPGTIFVGYEDSLRFYHKEIIRVSLGLLAFLGYGFFVIKNRSSAYKTAFLYFFFLGIGIPLVLALISFVKPLYLPRYFIFSVIGLLLLITFILEHLPKFPKIIIYMLFVAVSLNFHSQQIKDRKKSDLRTLIRQAKFVANPDDVMYVINELDYFPAQYYFGEDRVYVYGKSYEEIPNYVGKVLIAKSRFISALPVYPKKAFILTSDSRYEIQSAR